MECPNCWYEMEDGYCPDCGYVGPGEPSTTKPILVRVSVLVVIGVMAYLFFIRG